MLASANDCKIPQQSNEFPMCGGKVGVSMHDAMSVFDNCIITPSPPPPKKNAYGCADIATHHQSTTHWYI